MAIVKNTTPDNFDENEGKVNQDEILMNEEQLLKGLLDAGNAKDDPAFYEKIQVRRNGEVKFEFRIRPLAENESRSCYEKATHYAKHKANEPKTAIDVNYALARSWLIYAATINEDRAKTWENQRVLKHFNLLEGVDMIDRVLLAGEKDKIVERINDISGFGDGAEELAKN
jgi:hypothetical protein